MGQRQSLLALASSISNPVSRSLYISFFPTSTFLTLFPLLYRMKDSAAELLQVSWLEVTCSTDNVEVGKSYKVGFNLSMTAAAFGWKGCTVYIMAKIGKAGMFVYKKVCLDTKETNFDMPEEGLVITVKPPTSSPGDNHLYFGMYEVWSGRWKGGLKIHHAFVEKVN